jgi:hypothetical protein
VNNSASNDEISRVRPEVVLAKIDAKSPLYLETFVRYYGYCHNSNGDNHDVFG